MKIDPDAITRALQRMEQAATPPAFQLDEAALSRAVARMTAPAQEQAQGFSIDEGAINRALAKMTATPQEQPPPAFRVDPADSVGEFLDRWTPLQAIMTKYYDPDQQAWWQKGLNATLGAVGTVGQSALGAFLGRDQTESVTDMMQAARAGGALNAGGTLATALKYNPLNLVWDPVTASDPDKAWYRRIPEAFFGAPIIAMRRMKDGWSTEDLNRAADYYAMVAGMGGDVLLDPATYTTFGAGPLYKEANKVLRATPKTGSAVPVEQLGREALNMRHAARITPENEAQAAAMLTQQRIEGSLSKMADTPADVAKVVEDTLQSAYGDGREAFEKLLETTRARKDLPKTAGPVPQSVFDPTTTVDKRLQDLAEHQVGIERTLANQRPGTRMFGVQLGIPGTNLKLPSPFDLAGKAGSKLVGNWEQVQTLSRPLDDMLPELDAITVDSAVDVVTDPKAKMVGGKQGQFASVTPQASTTLGALTKEGLREVFEPITGQKIPDSFAVGDIPRLIETAQLGRQSAPGLTKFGIITDAKGLREFLKRDLMAFAPQDRARMFDYWYGMYATTGEVLKRNPKAVTNTTRARVDEAVATLGKLRKDKTFWKELTDPTRGNRPVEDYYDEMMQSLANFNANVSKTRTEWETAIQAGDAVGASKALYQLQKNFQDLAVRDVFKFYENFDGFNQARMPFQVARKWRQQNVNLLESAQKEAVKARELLDSVRKGVLSTPKMGDVDFILQSLGKNPDMLDELKTALKDRKGGGTFDDPAQVPLLQSWHLASTWKRQVADMAAAGKVDAAQATQAIAFIDDVAKQPRALNELAFFLNNVRKDAEHSSLVGQVMDQITDPYATFMGKALEAGQKVHAEGFRRLQEDWGKMQAIHDPNAFGKAYLKWAKQYDGLMGDIFNAAGFSPDIVEVLQRNEAAPQVASDRAVSEAQDFIASTLEPTIAGIAGGKTLARQQLRDVFRGYVLVKHNEAAQAAVYDAPDKTKWVNIKAQENVAEGYRLLEGVFGDRATADKAIAAINKDLRPQFDATYNKARDAGIPVQYREDYLPLLLNAKPADLSRFKKALLDFETDAQVKATTPIVSDFLGSAQVRTSDSMAELQWKIDQTKRHVEKTTQGRETFNVDVMDDLAQVFTHHKYTTERAVLAKRIIAEMQTVMPEHTLFVKHVAEADKNAMLTNGWKDLGDLVPGMKDYLVRDQVYDLFKKFAPEFTEPTAGISWALGLVGGWMRWLKKVNTTFDLMHLKNIAELALIPGVSPVEFAATLKGMWKNRPRVSGVGTAQERAVTPLSAIAQGIEGDDFYRLAEENGLFSFKGHESMLPPHERIAAWMEPQRAQDWFRLQKMWSGLKNGNGPFDVIQFDIVDRAAKLTLFKKYVGMGLTPRQAADATNRWLVDYSLRWMNPELKKWGYAFDPFFAWHFNNIMMHVPNAAVNPAKYALFDHFRRYITEETVGTDLYAAHYPEFLTEYALATEMENPRTGMREWVFPDAPWTAPIELIEGVAGDPAKTMQDPAMAGKRIVRFAANRMQPIFSAALGLYSARENKVPFNLSRAWWGDENNPGLFRDVLWGPQPAFRLGGALIDPEQWDKLGPIARRELINQFIRMQPALPSPAQGLKMDPGS